MLKAAVKVLIRILISQKTYMGHFTKGGLRAGGKCAAYFVAASWMAIL
jgi:hypothetical protein